MSSVFLFGAGASYGSGPCHPNPPPLGADLFPALQAAGGIAATVSSDLADEFVLDFEKGMDRFFAEHNMHTAELLRDMARFIAPFEPLSGNAYIELIRILGGTCKRATMVTTNYDLMIERAIAHSGLMTAYHGFPVANQYVPVLKIHGSCNFLPSQQFRFSGIKFEQLVSGDQIGNNSLSILDVDVDVDLARSAAEIIRFCDREDSIAPALAMYSPSKLVLFCPRYIQKQRDAWIASLSQATRIYVIGLRVHLVDEHIWGPLAKAKSPLYYVGREPDEFNGWAHSSSRKSAYVLTDSFESALPLIALHHGYRANKN